MDKWLIKKRKLSEAGNSNSQAESKISTLESGDCISQVENDPVNNATADDNNDQNTKNNKSCEGMDTDDNSNNSSYFDVDISKYLKILPSDALMNAFNNVWMPEEKFSFPANGKRNLRFQFTWFKRFEWLVYSKDVQGAFCKTCIFFGHKVGGVNNQALKSLVTSPFDKWQHAIEQFTTHQKTKYHENAVLCLEDRRKVNSGKILPVSLQVDEAHAKIIEENKKKLVPIVEAVLLCGRQGLALRGNNDYGDITENEPVENDGNFRALLRFRAKTDIDLQNHLKSSKKNAKYISKRIQNEIIECAHEVITQKIVQAVNSAGVFSVLADETADISNTEQMSVVLRYYNEQTKKIHEDFLTYVPVRDCSGKGLADSIMNCLHSKNLKSEFLVGQGYDGARAMSGEFHGAQAYIQERHKMALYVHCASHSLNLAISQACDIPQIRNCMGTIEAVYNFFNTPKREAELSDRISAAGNETKAHKLKQLCRTRWTEKHEAVETFNELQPYVIESLEAMKSWRDSQTSSNASRLLSAITTAEFQISCKVMSSIHNVIIPLSRVLQSENMDLAMAVKLAKCAQDELKSYRECAESNFKKIFQENFSKC